MEPFTTRLRYAAEMTHGAFVGLGHGQYLSWCSIEEHAHTYVMSSVRA